MGQLSPSAAPSDAPLSPQGAIPANAHKIEGHVDTKSLNDVLDRNTPKMTVQEIRGIDVVVERIVMSAPDQRNSGLSAEEAKNLQTVLQNHGFYHGNIHGHMDEATIQGVRTAHDFIHTKVTTKDRVGAEQGQPFVAQEDGSISIGTGDSDEKITEQGLLYMKKVWDETPVSPHRNIYPDGGGKIMTYR